MIVTKENVARAEEIKYEVTMTPEILARLDFQEDDFHKILDEGLEWLGLNLLPYGVDVRKEELIFSMQDDWESLTAKFIMRWEAPRAAIKFQGGDPDGLIIAIPHWVETYAVKSLVTQLDKDAPEPDREEIISKVVEQETLDYNYAGFDTEDRVTVFKLAE